MRPKDAKMKVCPKCGCEVRRFGGSWANAFKTKTGNYTFRIEFCLNPDCDWTRKLWRVYPEYKESDWKYAGDTVV